jgi:hypothetical protein
MIINIYFQYILINAIAGVFFIKRSNVINRSTQLPMTCLVSHGATFCFVLSSRQLLDVAARRFAVFSSPPNSAKAIDNKS